MWNHCWFLGLTLMALFSVNPLAGGEAKKDTEEEKKVASEKNDFRTPILPPIRKGETPRCIEDCIPTDARVLRALATVTNEAGACEVSRANVVKIVKECVVNKVDPPRFFPLIGPARLHHLHWKCTVTYNQTIVVGCSFIKLVISLPRTDVVYVDLDHLHRMSEGN